MSGAQCHRLLWWRRHEPEAAELQPDKVLQDLFDQGHLVGKLAQEQFPGGVLIPYATSRSDRAHFTQEVINSGAQVIYEASFIADNIFVACDILLKEGDGWRLIEVKSSSSLKEQHLEDVAVQSYVASLAGLHIKHVEVMYLNKEFRHPDQGELFVRDEVTDRLKDLLLGIPDEAARQIAVLDGPIPEVEIGLHCEEPYPCPFHDRCWPHDERHISRLYNVGIKRCVQYMASGVHSIDDLPRDRKLPHAAKRQLRSLETGNLIVEQTLANALSEYAWEGLGFLDFETIMRAVPVWHAMKPWEAAAAQFSYHEGSGNGEFIHQQHLAEGPLDARPLIAERLIHVTRNASKVVTYSSFEKTRIRALKESVPDLAAELTELEEKLVDLLPVVRNHVYHPEFRGSFSLKAVLPALIPELDYSDLVIVDGRVASVEIARLLFVADRIPADERDRVRQDLLDYCERDTWAMVRLLQELRRIAGMD